MPRALSLASRALLPVVLLIAVGCKRDTPPPPPVAAVPVFDLAQVRDLFKPLPARFSSPGRAATSEAITLGRMLYFDPRMSMGRDLSCNTCHLLDKGGVDGERFSKGHKGQLGARNAPTVFNAAGQISQFWDGRAADVEEQAKGPVLNPVEMAMPDPGYVLRVLGSIPGYVVAFDRAFPGQRPSITYDNFGAAIGAFERGLVTPTRFDALLAREDGALDATERAGLARFIATGCAGCHAGALVGGSSYMKLGLVTPYENQADTGRFALTKNEADRMVFKVPSLRNVADTAPYFHDGSIADLPTAVRTMARLQLGKQLGDDDVASIVSFLRTLSGAPPPGYADKPDLPPDGATTPKVAAM
jgi:cytochrome c peroxidase